MTQHPNFPAAGDLRDIRELLEGILPSQPALASVRFVTMTRPRHEVPFMSLRARLTQAAPPSGTPVELTTNVSSCVLVSSRLISPWEVTEEFFADNPELDDEQAERMMFTAVGNDLQDLAFNGDEASPDILLRAQDGWLKRMTLHRRWTLRRRAVRAKDLAAALASLAPAYRADRERLRFFVSMDTYLDLLDTEMDTLGDDYEADKPAPKHLTLNEVPVIAVPMLDKSHALVTNPSNLILGFEREYRVRKTTEGVEAIERDSRFYVAHIRMALQVQNAEAGFHIEARPWHVVLGRFGAFVAKQFARTKGKLKRVVREANNRRQARREAAQGA